MLNISNKKNLSYLIGLAIGDGNLSNPNGRAVRLRITCDKKYPYIIKEVLKILKKIAPKNRVTLIKRKDNAVDISCYSNDWEKILGWKAKSGSKIKQKISIPLWIKNNNDYIKNCLRGLFQTDGSIYMDRNYLTVNFVTCIPTLMSDIEEMIRKIGFKPNLQKTNESKNKKYTLRVNKDASEFIKAIKLKK